MKNVLIILTTFSLLFGYACSKCDENSPGDCKTCYEKLAGDWTLNYLATNGIDSIFYFDSVFNSSCVFSFDLYNKNEYYALGANMSISWGSTSGEFLFTGGYYGPITKDSRLAILADFIGNTNSLLHPLINFGAFYWQIIRLSENDLWIQLQRENNLYEMHLNK